MSEYNITHIPADTNNEGTKLDQTSLINELGYQAKLGYTLTCVFPSHFSKEGTVCNFTAVFEKETII